MKEQNLNIRYMVAQLSELSQQEQELVNRAKAATSNAYANYSHFYVGAALLLGDGRIVIGANQENAAFPSGLCAERSAIFGAVLRRAGGGKRSSGCDQGSNFGRYGSAISGTAFF